MRKFTRYAGLALGAMLALMLALGAATLSGRSGGGIRAALADLAECALDSVLGGDCKALAGQYVLSAAPSDCPYGTTLSGDCEAGTGDYVLNAAPTGCGHDQLLSGDCTAASGDYVSTGQPSTCPRPDSSCDGSSTAKAAESCDQLFYSGITSDGIYWLKPRGTAAFQAYCDMESGVGGWTLVAGMASGNTAHETAAAVTSGNLTSPSGLGKYSDALINTLKKKEYRLTCGGVTAYFSASCTFNATTGPTGPCEYGDFAPGGTAGEGYYSVGTAAYSGGGTFGLEWDRSDGLGPVYGANPGCGRHYVGAGYAGTLWVR